MVLGVIYGDNMVEIYPPAHPIWEYFAKSIVTKNIAIFKWLEPHINLGPRWKCICKEGTNLNIDFG